MRIMLINPRSQVALHELVSYSPLGLAYVGAALRRKGHQVSLIDQMVCRETNNEIGQITKRDRIEAIGITSSSSVFKAALELSGTIRRMSPRTRIIMGGVHPTLVPKDVVAHDCVDYVVHGEGEFSTPELLETIEAGRLPDRVLGVAFKKGGSVSVNNPRPFCKDLDDLPFPAYDLLPLSRYKIPQISRTPVATMITSRGCPYNCIFCDAHVVLGKAYRAHSPERVVEEIQHLKRDFHTRTIVFKDSEFTLNYGRVERICNLMIEKAINCDWTCNGRVGSVDAGLLKKMRHSGCRLIAYGVESGDQEILNTLRKQITIEQVRETFRLTKEAGIRTTANFMIGNPGDNRKSIRATIELSKELRTDFVSFGFCTPFPGTELYRMAQENRWMPESADYSDLHPDRCVMNATTLSTNELSKLKKEAFRSFYLRPSVILSRFFTIRPHKWKTNLAGLIRVLRP